MSLFIDEHDNIFLLQGKINSNTANDLTNYFSLIREKAAGQITINIDGIDEIDVSGLNALKQIMNFSSNQTRVSITGNGCRDIYREFLGE